MPVDSRPNSHTRRIAARYTPRRSRAVCAALALACLALATAGCLESPANLTYPQTDAAGGVDMTATDMPETTDMTTADQGMPSDMQLDMASGGDTGVDAGTDMGPRLGGECDCRTTSEATCDTEPSELYYCGCRDGVCELSCSPGDSCEFYCYSGGRCNGTELNMGSELACEGASSECQNITCPSGGCTMTCLDGINCQNAQMGPGSELTCKTQTMGEGGGQCSGTLGSNSTLVCRDDVTCQNFTLGGSSYVLCAGSNVQCQSLELSDSTIECRGVDTQCEATCTEGSCTMNCSARDASTGSCSLDCSNATGCSLQCPMGQVECIDEKKHSCRVSCD